MTPARYPVTIPACLYGVGLRPGERELIALVHALSSGGRRCTAGADWLAERLDIPERTMYRLLARLTASGWIVADGAQLQLGRPIGHDRATVTCTRASVQPSEGTPLPKWQKPAAKMATTTAILAVASKDLGGDSSADKAVADSKSDSVVEESHSAAVLDPLEERLEQLFVAEIGRKGGEASTAPENSQGDAALPGETRPPSAGPYVETPGTQESRFIALTAREVAELSPDEAERLEEERLAAATELADRGLDGTAPLKWAREKSLARVLEVCRWADLQKWRKDPARCPREITCALREGYGTAPEHGSEAEEVTRPPSAPTAEERARRRREALFQAFRLYGTTTARRLFTNTTDEEWAYFVAEWEEEERQKPPGAESQAAAVRATIAELSRRLGGAH